MTNTINELRDMAMYRRIAGPNRYEAARAASLQPDWAIAGFSPRWKADALTDEALRAMTIDDYAWLDRQWQLAGGEPPGLDLSWVTTEQIGDGGGWVALIVAALLVLAFVCSVVRLTR